MQQQPLMPNFQVVGDLAVMTTKSNGHVVILKAGTADDLERMINSYLREHGFSRISGELLQE